MEIKNGDETIYLGELTSDQQDRLESLIGHNDSPITSIKIEDTACAACRQGLTLVRWGWPLNIIGKIGGCYCPNRKCEFYRVFLPAGSYEKLTTIKTKNLGS
jgi:hypothetical protein